MLQVSVVQLIAGLAAYKNAWTPEARTKSSAPARNTICLLRVLDSPKGFQVKYSDHVLIVVHQLE